MAKIKHDYKVGDKVFIVWSSNRRTQKTDWMTVEKVGHKWATFFQYSNAYRISLKDNRIDGGDYCSPGKAYFSEEQYQQEKQKKYYTKELTRLLPYSLNDSVMVSDILAAAKLLQIDLPPVHQEGNDHAEN